MRNPNRKLSIKFPCECITSLLLLLVVSQFMQTINQGECKPILVTPEMVTW